jgi:hypothetical protein
MPTADFAVAFRIPLLTERVSKKAMIEKHPEVPKFIYRIIINWPISMIVVWSG